MKIKTNNPQIKLKVKTRSRKDKLTKIKLKLTYFSKKVLLLIFNEDIININFVNKGINQIYFLSNIINSYLFYFYLS